MELENRPLKNSERRAGRICLLVIIGFSATMLVLTCMDIMYRSTGFIIVYSALIVISIALMATILRADTLDSTSEEKEKSNEAMIIAQATAEMNKKLAEKKASEDAASSSENETDSDDEHESETDDGTTALLPMTIRMTMARILPVLTTTPIPTTMTMSTQMPTMVTQTTHPPKKKTDHRAHAMAR